ncbi:LacI family DNA-binding transcriptional regulator [Arthrobacter sp. PO-11]|uniref:LacI family DNA-binding transcriptional regulator n=1 Tax=Arthrobacter cavernae TaxID=2817681 RepID=A0A939KKP4_9MICC|nr:LacI family DNA-binding transcriptional regulator [Arthrobacter cavernae]
MVAPGPTAGAVTEPALPPRAADIRDVAAAAGVSTATVSRALRGVLRVAAATRKRVLEAAADLGYVPSAAASELALGRGAQWHSFPARRNPADLQDAGVPGHHGTLEGLLPLEGLLGARVAPYSFLPDSRRNPRSGMTTAPS